jgi:hypothetical protein
MLPWVAVSSEPLYPVVVTSGKVPDDIYCNGYRPGKEFVIQRNSMLDVDGPLLNVSFVIDLFRTQYS